jgi:ABC-type phosphate transport system substrate-binding protein
MPRRRVIQFLLAFSIFSANIRAEEIAVVVSNANNVNTLSRDDVINIFMGRYRQYSNKLTANPIDNLALKDKFYQALVSKTLPEINAYWARLIFSGRTYPPPKVSNTNEAIQALEENPLAISYINTSDIKPMTKVVFILEVK